VAAICVTWLSTVVSVGSYVVLTTILTSLPLIASVTPEV
jgi:hypothetical protein